MTEATVLALVAIVGSVITALFKLLNDNTKAQNATAGAMKSLVEETRKGNEEAAERNGHLGEQNIQITELIATHTTKTIEAIDGIKSQHVDQHVDTQVVDSQVIKTKE